MTQKTITPSKAGFGFTEAVSAFVPGFGKVVSEAEFAVDSESGDLLLCGSTLHVGGETMPFVAPPGLHQALLDEDFAKAALLLG